MTSTRFAVDVEALDPFAEQFLADPYPYHAALRDAGPLVRLERSGIWAVARHAEVKRVLGDWHVAGFADELGSGKVVARGIGGRALIVASSLASSLGTLYVINPSWPR